MWYVSGWGHDMNNVLPKADCVDIMLLLEGTFPYVSGGVSGWVNQIIRGFPEYRFGVVFIGSAPDDYNGFKYELPENLVHMEEWYLHAVQATPPIVPQRGDGKLFPLIRQLHNWFRREGELPVAADLKTPDFYTDTRNGMDLSQFLYAEESWNMITDLYEKRCTDPSFVDFFWTVRNMHVPIWHMADIATRLVPAKVYHTISTGYAGLLGAFLHYKTGRPLILSEHGIYTKERRIDIFHSDWIRDNRNALQRDPTEVSYFRELWIRFFETLGRLCYEASDQIVSLYEGARVRQIYDGAPEQRTVSIPNGIDISRFSRLREQRPVEVPPVLCMMGRVVPIKDVKTFIRAVRIAANHIPEVEGWIVGPADEDPGYLEECRSLAESLSIADRINFRGFMDPAEVYPGSGLLVLSSISEGVPLVILEAFAAGLPVIATDVGGCRQLVNGCGADDEACGRAGEVVEINNPQAIADAVIRLLKDSTAWQSAQAVAVDRVERIYSQEIMLESYRGLYQKRIG